MNDLLCVNNVVSFQELQTCPVSIGLLAAKGPVFSDPAEINERIEDLRIERTIFPHGRLIHVNIHNLTEDQAIIAQFDNLNETTL